MPENLTWIKGMQGMGGGGCSGSNFEFSWYLITCSPDFLVFRMGPSVPSHRNDVCHPLRAFVRGRGDCRRICLKTEHFHRNGRKSENLSAHFQSNLVHLMALPKRLGELWELCMIFRECWNFGFLKIFEHFVRGNRPENEKFHYCLMFQVDYRV